MSISDVITNFGDVILLDYPCWNLENSSKILIDSPHWKPYNPRKSNNRKGLSVTSIDGGYSGIPDLDSLREYNLLYNTRFNESHFKTRTSIASQIPELNFLLDEFPDHGRCHFLKLDSGGFFPPHRDNGLNNLSPNTFRLIVPIYNFGKYHITWNQDGTNIYFDPGLVYFVNTTKVHSVFSFVDNAICFVMNIISTNKSLQHLIKHCAIK